MAKGGKKKGSRRSNPAAATSKKKTVAAKPTNKRSRQAKPATVPGKAGHHAVFRSLAARSNQHNKAPVCYQQLSDGSWMICFLQSDGSYAQCQAYSGPIHQPPCG